jgi:hypothetical protein
LDDDFAKHYVDIAEDYLIDGDLTRIQKKYEATPSLDEILNYITGEDGSPAFGIPSANKSENWYEASKSHEFWPAYLSLLVDRKRKNFPTKAAQTIDRTSSRIVNHIYNPKLEGPQQTYGLVVGYVQSGKTANFSGVIAKAADSGFKLIVVLSGMFNDLRQQTQIRLSQEITGQSSHSKGHHVDGSKFTNQWHEITTDDIKQGDIHQSKANKDLSHLRDNRPCLVVTKKQVDALNALISWSSGLTPEERDKIDLLLIDDEADVASINTEAKSDITDANVINKRLRTFLHMYKRRAYVGYTATPFANVFINPRKGGDGVVNDEGKPPTNEFLDTLYPGDFIVALPKPDNYLGFLELFPTNSDESGPKYSNCTRKVLETNDDGSDGEAIEVRKMTHDEFAPLTTGLGEAFYSALRDHLITHALRIIRKKGVDDFHHSMLVHTKITKKSMRPLVSRIDLLMQKWAGAFRTKEPRRKDRQKIVQEFNNHYANQFASKDKWSHDSDPPDWDEVHDLVMRIFKEKTPDVIEVSSDEDEGENLDYHAVKYSGKGRNVIAVGGQRLSRGLTLEGLTVSYFIRTAAEMKYDTVMQQGRWFGFRPGFEDLVRIYTTPDLLEKLTRLGRIEQELRDSIERYEDTGKTPRDFAVKVMKAKAMIPTADCKQPNIAIEKSNIDERIVPSWGQFNFDKPDLLEKNLQSAAKFINKLGSATPSRKSHLWKKKNYWNKVKSFLQSLHFRDAHFDQEFYEYVERRIAAGKDELSEWSIALVSKQTGIKTKPLEKFGCNLEIVQATRSRHADKMTLGYFPQSDNFTLDLSGIVKDYSKDNGSFSFPKMWKKRSPKNPLMLIYVFDKNSPGEGDSKQPMFSKGENAVDILAVSIALPKADLSDSERENEYDVWYSAFLPKDPEDRNA